MYAEKKITLRHFANVTLKGMEPEFPGGGELFPLYLEIIYRRQHIQIKSLVNKMVDLEMGNLSLGDKIQLKAEVELVTKIIRFEESLKGENHKIAGLGKRYTNYRASIFEVIDDTLRVELKKAILKSKPEQAGVINFENRNIIVKNLFLAAQQLWPDLGDFYNIKKYQQKLDLWEEYFKKYPQNNKIVKYPTFIDWLAEGHYEKFYKVMLKKNKIDNEILDESLNWMNNIIHLAIAYQ